MEPLSAYGALLLIAGLQLKHMVFDGPGQTPRMLAEKGIYGARGGLFHSGNHLIGSLAVLLVLGVPWLPAVILAVGDGIVHYHIDYAKEQLVKLRRWTPKDRGFWWTLAIDQSLHHLTYIVMVAILIESAS